MSPAAMTDHGRIYLEPEDDSNPDTGRMWCQHPAPGAGDDRTWTEYVRADLVAAREDAAEARGMERAVEIAAKHRFREEVCLVVGPGKHGFKVVRPRDASAEIAAAICAAAKDLKA